MNKLEKVTRVITIPPFVAGVMVLLLYLGTHCIDFKDFVAAEACLVLVPCLAYPIGSITRGKKDMRDSQRNAALVLSGVGYALGLAWTFIYSSSNVMKVLFMAYMISIVVLLFINKIIKFKASGHACSTTAPIVMLTWQMGALAIAPGLLLIAAVYYSSLKLKRHTLPQLIAGSCISLLAVCVAVLIFA